MNILITAASASSHISGVQRHAFNMVRCLLAHPDIMTVHLALAPWQREMVESAGLSTHDRLTLHYEAMERSSIARNIWYYRQLPKLVSRLQPDLVHLSYPMPVNASAIGCPTVLTLHDLYPYEIPRNFGLHQFLFNRLVLRQCLASVDAIACVSDTTMTRLKQYVPVAVHLKARRIYNCVEPEPVCAMHAPFDGWMGEPFLLNVSQHRRNKNIPLLIKVFDRLLCKGLIDPSMRLIVIGIEGPETGLIERLVSRLRLERNILFLKGMSEAELQWFYAHCEALVLPSTTEGFGLPVAEAILAGCRVVCSDIPAFREIGGERCEFFGLGTHAEENLVAGIKAALLKPFNNPLPLPHLSSPVLAHEYARLYRSLMPGAADAKNLTRAASIQQTTTERQSL